jgi:prostaglandin-endoperoxide synthase 2
MVGIDAFSQALTNPLLSERVFNETTFSDLGWKTINETQALSDIVHRNLQGENCDPLVTFEYSATRQA